MKIFYIITVILFIGGLIINKITSKELDKNEKNTNNDNNNDNDIMYK